MASRDAGREVPVGRRTLAYLTKAAFPPAEGCAVPLDSTGETEPGSKRREPARSLLNHRQANRLAALVARRIRGHYHQVIRAYHRRRPHDAPDVRLSAGIDGGRTDLDGAVEEDDAGDLSLQLADGPRNAQSVARLDLGGHILYRQEWRDEIDPDWACILTTDLVRRQLQRLVEDGGVGQAGH